ncbi:MAG: RNA polymerase subunit sigma-54 [Acidiferrobacteraceae bacterium]|nr:RNA polymerase subunit sigma-54 [Acidiferrobacteraceae bacterium]|tara:strand:- start:52 stop:912 length:861 start_codon:yes stop_codon:yes gene_type:complete
MRGIAYMSVFAFCMASMITAVRYISQDLHPFEIAFFRAFFGFVFFLPILVRYGIDPLRTSRLPLHFLRSLFHVTSVLLFFFGVSVTPLAKAMSISFSAPLFASILAFVFLSERLNIARIASLLSGLIGMLVILRPGLIEVNMGSLAIIVAAASWGTAMIIVKILSTTESTVTTTMYSTIFMMPVTLIIALGFWTLPSVEHLAWLALIGALASVGHIALARAMREGDVTVVLPVDFTKIIWASMFGYIFFAEIPDWETWVGGAIIFTAVALIAYQERNDKTRLPLSS